MAWDFIKKIVGTKEEEKKPAAAAAATAPAAPAAPAAKAPAQAQAAPASPVKEKPVSEKTDDELAAELDKMSPQILSQAKDPQMRALIIGIYRKMLMDNVDVSDDKEVKKWMKKHPEVLQGGETVKVETVRREEPKVGRNDPCPCGSGKKYKKCCGSGK
jgi:pyruvate/2-oxoglutarate dehydrogenase complex dihydrolipoamide acyltransferase (E2) component